MDYSLRLHEHILACSNHQENQQVLLVLLPTEVQENGEEEILAVNFRKGRVLGDRGLLHPEGAVRALGVPVGGVVSIDECVVF